MMDIRFNKKGSALILALLVTASAVILSAAILSKSVSEANFARRNLLSEKAFYLSEAGIEKTAYTLAYNTANHLSPPVSGTITDFLSSGFTLNYTCVDLDSSDSSLTDSTGVSYFIRHYQITASVVDPNSGVEIVLNQVVVRKKTYAFQHAVFYADDLEILPGPNMTLSGRIHSNHDIYLGANKTLTIDTDYMYSAGNIYNRRKNDGSRSGGDIKIRVKDSSPPSYDYMEKSGDYLDSDNPDWTDESQTRWAGTVKSSVHGVKSLAVPVVGSVQPDGYYAQNSGLKIIKKTGGEWQLSSEGKPLLLSDLPEGTITEKTFKDNRENTVVTVTDIDVSKLNSSGYFPSNGLIYASREDASPSSPNGVRLVNGSELNSGLTLVSNDPVYIKGDYNTVDKKPAAVICDAVNILSNNWDDAKDMFSQRYASDTEVNSAFISGIVPTPDGGGNYSGGLENYPRLNEKWSGKDLKIRGSFVELWLSQIAKGEWRYGSPVYEAPYRDWDYDIDFNDSSKLPPFTPFAVEIEGVAWWKS